MVGLMPETKKKKRGPRGRYGRLFRPDPQTNTTAKPTPPQVESASPKHPTSGTSPEYWPKIRDERDHDLGDGW